MTVRPTYVAQMRLDNLRLLMLRRFLLRFVQLLDQRHGLASQPAVELAPHARGQ